jgi:hypothetical protein
MIDLFKDKKSLIFINSKIEFMSMKTTDDFIALDDFEIITEDELITYQSETNIMTHWQNDSNMDIKKYWSKYDLMIEVSYEKLRYDNLKDLNKKFLPSKKMIGLRLMTFETIDSKTKREYNGVNDFKKIEIITIKPKQTLQREIENETYDLKSLIKEFKRGNKLDDLGI